jgi:molybdopterin-synthase adenylyltransferase
LMMLDSLRMEWNTMRIARQPDCPVCGEAHRFKPTPPA